MKTHGENKFGSRQNWKTEKVLITCVRTLQEVEELKRICCSEAERTQELRTGGLLRHELRESQPSVNQLTFQIQEPQERVNSLNDSTDFHDPGLNHVPSHPFIAPISFRKLCRDSGPQPDTRNLFGTSEKLFFENLPSPHEQTAVCFGNSRSLAETQCEPYTKICQEVFNFESSLSCKRSLSAK